MGAAASNRRQAMLGTVLMMGVGVCLIAGGVALGAERPGLSSASSQRAMLHFDPFNPSRLSVLPTGEDDAGPPLPPLRSPNRPPVRDPFRPPVRSPYIP